MKRITILVLCICMVFTVFNFGVVYASDRPVAFPGAEGGGMYVTGARGVSSPDIYHITNLNDSGAGSFRDAVSEDGRIIVFDVDGTIKLKSALRITHKNLTILGQTAPGDGICFSDYPFVIASSNIILRYLRFRMGTAGKQQEDSFGSTSGENVIVDHCSVSWSVDECLSVYAVKNYSIQWCIISESLNNSIHDKGAHGYGGIWGGVNSTFHHNLIADHTSRMPRIGTSETVRSYNNGPDTDGLIDIRNNVFYNWKNNSGYGGENGVRVNFVNNYYKPGPATQSSVKDRIYEIYGGSSGLGTDVAVAGNYVEGSEEVTLDNTKGVDVSSSASDYIISTEPHTQYLVDYPVNTQSAVSAYEDVLNYAGASYRRDSVDERIVNETRGGTFTYGTKGIIDSTNDVFGWPVLKSGIKSVDTDGDGISDEWEDLHGLNKTLASDALIKNSEGYLNIEAYANDILNPTVVDKTKLNEQINNIESLNKDHFKNAVWDSAELVLSNAKLTAQSETASQSEVRDMVVTLTNLNESLLSQELKDVIMVADGSFNEDKWVSNSNVNCTVDILNTTESNKNVLVVVAVYEGNSLVDAELKNITIDSDERIRDCQFSVKVGENPYSSRMKAFLWDMDSMNPIGGKFILVTK